VGRNTLPFATAQQEGLLMALPRRKPGDMSEKHLKRVRRICAALPETTEKLSHGEPTFFVRKKVFAMFSNNHHYDGHVSVLVPAPPGVQAMLIEASPAKFYKPPYVGVRGWVGIELARITDDELASHIRQAWLMIAPKTLAATLQQQ
jgi:hypothetical protein